VDIRQIKRGFELNLGNANKNFIDFSQSIFKHEIFSIEDLNI